MLGIAKGCLSMVIIALSTIIWCAWLYLLGLIRLIVPHSATKAALGRPMDRVIDGWVSVNRVLLRVLNLASIEVSSQRPMTDRESWYVIMSNHQSWADILVLQVAFRDLVPPLKFFTKRELIWAPLVGVAMWFLGFPYVHRQKQADDALDPKHRAINRETMLEATTRFHERPVAVLSFLEGTRFTVAKHQKSNSPFKHLLKPRVGGIAFTLSHLEDVQPKILDATIRYEGQVPDFWSFLCGRCNRIHLEFEEVSAPALATSDLELWIDDLWSKKDSRLDELSSSSTS